MTAFFDLAEQNKFALFPCAQGTKRPILKWKTGSTFDRTQWTAWQAEHNNLAIDCAKSGIIVIDVDASKVTREEAWGAYHALCLSWGLPEPAPSMTHSARGGWHIPFKRPANLAATDLRGGGTLVKISDFRQLAEGEKDGEVVGFKNRGYCVAPGSNLSTSAGNLPYLLMTNPPAPHEAPDGLIDAIKLKAIEATYSGQAGASDKADVAKLVAELDMFGEFSTEPDWWKYMGAIKLALDDTEDGVEVALQMTTDDATSEAFWSRWNRLASVDDGGQKCRINSMIHRYKELTGKHFNVRKSFGSMLGGTGAMTVKAAGADVATVNSADAPTQPSAPSAANKPPTLPAQPKQSQELPLIFFDEARNAPLQRFHIKGFIAEGATSSVFAHPKKMKSTAITDAGVHLAAGKDWRGLRISEARGVCYFAFERAIQVRQALAAYAIRDGLENLPFAIVPRLVNVLDPGCVELIKNAIDRVQQRHGIEVALAVFDTWNKGIAAGGGNEDKAEHQNVAAANLRRLIEQLPALHCLTIGHAGKDVSKGERGSNATEGDRDAGFAIKGENGKYALEVAYSNALPEGEIITTFEGELVEIGKNEEGDPVNSFILSRQPVALPLAKTARTKMPEKQQLALEALGDVLKSKGRLGQEVGGRSVTLDEWREQCFRNGSISRSSANPWRDLHDRQIGLIARGRIVVLDDNVRIIGEGAKSDAGNVISMMPGLPTNSVPLPPGMAGMPITRAPS